MSAQEPPKTKATLGLTGLTINAMALIAPGAFLWLTFQMQSLYGAPMASSAMWMGIVAALLLCFATAISYAELSKLYPGAGSSYFFAEQAFLSKTKAFKFARIAKFATGWASHLYYWVYPGCMVGVTAILAGYLLNQLWPDTFAGNYSSLIFMAGFCVLFAMGVAYIAFRGVSGTTGVNMAINIVQIAALLVFSMIALGYRLQHGDGSVGYHFSAAGVPVNYVIAQETVKDKDGKPLPVLDDKQQPTKDDKGAIVYQMQERTVTADDLKGVAEAGGSAKAVPLPPNIAEGDAYPELQKDKDGKLIVKDGHAMAVDFILSYKAEDAISTDKDGNETFNFHSSALSVVSPVHGQSPFRSLGHVFIQACIAILILVGFESVTSMGEEARNAKRDIPKAVLLSLAIQGIVCYLIEYFCGAFVMNTGYTSTQAGASSAPIGDLMYLTGTWFFHGSASAGRMFMLIEATTVFLALIGTTLSCLSTGARVTYAMGRDEEVPAHFGMLHGRRLTPHRSIWTLAFISAILGIITVSLYLGGSTPGDLDPKYHTFWYSIGCFNSDLISKLPNTLLIITLISNFGTFMLYMFTCLIAMVAFKEHESFNGLKHFVIPLFGLIANLVCMTFYLVGPFFVPGMSAKEPFIALGVCILFGGIGLVYFIINSKKRGVTVMVQAPARPVVGA